ncbi:MAG: hypothetical protein E7121_00205 [Bacteroidales bacterium]|nr:hypothetical protein [Bacteroidales bacterium]
MKKLLKAFVSFVVIMLISVTANAELLRVYVQNKSNPQLPPPTIEVRIVTTGGCDMIYSIYDGHEDIDLGSDTLSFFVVIGAEADVLMSNTVGVKIIIIKV